MSDDDTPSTGLDEKYRAFIDNSSEGIWRLDFQPPIDTSLSVERQVDLAYLNGRFAEGNLAMARMQGHASVKDVLGKSLDVMLAASHPGARAFLTSIVQAGYRADIESTGQDAQGRRRHFANTLTGIVENGSLLGVWGTQRDITVQKEAEAALRESEERSREMADALRRENEERAYLAAIVKSSDDAIISKDLNGIIRSCNAAAERMFGYSAEELIGRAVRIIIPADRQAEEDDIISRIRRGEQVDHFQTVRLAKDGRLVDVSLTVSPVRDATGRIVGASKIARDITAQKSAAAERDRLLEAERLARGEAERANRVKDDFVAMVSHELRTPLNAILGWTQLMSRTRHDPALIERGLDVVARNTRLQAQLISDLLDISRIIAGKLELEIRSVDLRAIVAEAIETIEQEAKAKGVEVDRELEEGASLVSGDASRLQQVVWNLVSNAVKFTPAGGRVRVTLRYVGHSAEIQVADTGAGIRPEFVPHVFERFHQADRSITRRFGGLGLGLSIVKNLVDLHGGAVRAESDGEGKGATFTITLPTVDASAIVKRRDLASPAAEADAAPLYNVCVLVVEDEADTLEYLRRLLENQGATVLTAATAAEALAAFRDGHPDVLISDIGLPEIDGYDLIRLVRRQDLPSHQIPAIALTAYARSEDRMRALRAGYQAHVAKPVEPAELVAMVASFVELSGSAH